MTPEFAAEVDQMQTASHGHSNKTLLDTYTQTDANIADAVSKKHSNATDHSHGNKGIIDTITQAMVDAWNTITSHISNAVAHITSEERTIWNSKAAGAHTHTKSQVTDFAHVHSKADVTDFPTIPSDTNQLTKTDVYTKTEVDGKLGSAGYGDMMKSTYDTTGNGVVDNAEKVNGLTVQTAVPAGAAFTDTVTTINGKTGTISKSDMLAVTGAPTITSGTTQPVSPSIGDLWVDMN